MDFFLPDQLNSRRKNKLYDLFTSDFVRKLKCQAFVKRSSNQLLFPTTQYLLGH